MLTQVLSAGRTFAFRDARLSESRRERERFFVARVVNGVAMSTRVPYYCNAEYTTYGTVMHCIRMFNKALVLLTHEAHSESELM